MNSAFDLKGLVDALQLPLPGIDQQMLLAHTERQLQPNKGVVPKKAGVLLLLYEKAGKVYFPLMERTSHYEKDKHKGQISFPGGKYELSDVSLEYTALREAQEELGIPADQVEVLGQLSPLYVSVSNFMIYPTLAYLGNEPDWILEKEEVERLIEVPVSELLKTDAIQRIDIKLGGGFKLKDAPYFNLLNEVVWGATAMVLSEFRQLVESTNAN